MKPKRQFESQLESLRQEASNAARYVYAELAIQHAASKSSALLSRLNLTPTFWLTCAAAFQSAAYMALGRIFDLSSKYNVEALLKAMEADLLLFQRDSLAERKRDGGAADPEWLSEYLAAAHYPTHKDIARLRKKVNDYRAIFDRVVKPARHQYFAHRVRHGHTEVQALFAGGTVKDLWRLTTFLLQLHQVLWDLLHNGRKPRFRPIRYSVKAIFDAESQSSEAHESIVGEVKTLMHLIECKTPNPSIEHTLGK